MAHDIWHGFVSQRPAEALPAWNLKINVHAMAARILHKKPHPGDSIVGLQKKITGCGIL